MKRITIFAVVFSLIVMSSLSLQLSRADDSSPLFSLDILCPNTDLDRIQWTNLISTVLPSIGINVASVDITDWGSVFSRTMSYPIGTYDYIPTYSEGGFDLLTIGTYWHYIDVFLGNNFNSEAIYPDGRNYFQYNSSSYDTLHNQYIVTSDPVERINLIYDFQNVLFDELPTIPILYNENFFVVKDGLDGIDYLLLGLSEYRAEYWDDPADHILNYSLPYTFDYYNAFRTYHAPVITTHNTWMQPVYGSLMKYSQNLHEFENEIANNVDIDVGIDSMDLTITLDPSAKFSDGNSVLPSDVKYSYELIMSPEVISPSYEDLIGIFDSKASISIVGSDVVGGQIKFELNKLTTFPERLLNYPIIDKSDIESKIASYGYDIFTEVPGTGNVGWSLVKSCGPMMLDNFDNLNSKANLIPNPYWHGLSTKLTQLNIEYEPNPDTALTKLLVGSVDLLDREYKFYSSNITGLVGIHSEISDSLVYQNLAVNMRHPIIGTGELTPLGTVEAAKNVRKAISYTIPKLDIISSVLEGIGKPAVSPIPPGCLGFNESLVFHEYSNNVARSYMELAGYSYVDKSEFSFLGALIFIIGAISICNVSSLKRSKQVSSPKRT